MRGLVKYLQQSLQIPVERPDSFRRLRINPEVSAAQFHENVSDFAVVYGLGVQALGASKITSNLLPKNIVRSMIWAGKAKYFAIASAIFLVVSALSLGRTIIDKANYAQNQRQRQKITSIIRSANQSQNSLTEQKNRGPEYEAIIEKQFSPFRDRDALVQVYQLVLSLLPNERNTPGQIELYQAFADNDVEKVLSVPRRERKQIFVTNLTVRYAGNLDYANFVRADFVQEASMTGGSEEDRAAMEQLIREELGGDVFGDFDDQSGEGGGTKRGFVVTMVGYSPYGDIGKLMDPAGVGDNKNKWGLITRLRNLDEMIVDGNCPFELYKRESDRHFKVEINEVGINRRIPVGIGEKSVRSVNEDTRTSRDEDILIDPMTEEIINSMPIVDRNGNALYQINDHWFILNFKLSWKDTASDENLSI